ncbi:MAG: hypothetical protein ACHQIL_03440 [Steroidobacterales bacterium]
MSKRNYPADERGMAGDASANQSQTLHVITLISSTAPMPLPVFNTPEFAHLAVFRSRRIEDGRERYRIHLGYFPSESDAERVLHVVRETYPWAFVALAPQANLGSLDDTAIARFRIVHPAEPAATASDAPVPDAAPAIRASTPVSQSPTPSPPVLSTANIVSTPMTRKRRAATAPAAPASPAAAPRSAPAAKPTQRYAVQLIWSKDPIDLSKIPSLAIFGGYLLYAVETEPGGRRMYGVRLGFYDDLLSARLVALYLRPTFKGVVVPVSDREVTRASGASIRLDGSPAVRGRITPRAAWPRAAVPVEAAAAHQMASGSR